MRESVLRTWHRNLGIVLAVFIILQAGRGFFISLSQMSVSHTHAHEESYPLGLASFEDTSLPWVKY